jgi:hypothetical protein
MRTTLSAHTKNQNARVLFAEDSTITITLFAARNVARLIRKRRITMVEQTKRHLIRHLKSLLEIFGVTYEEAPEVLAETLREYQEYFEVPKEVDHV